MRPKIKLLDDNLINQIAAGEVIENPASVVKELIENSIDAKGKNITVEIKGGGLQQIRIDDDGIGMTKEDILLALQRHATSKLSTFDDLLKISTLGFRGEAIPSIASISKMKIISSTDGDNGICVSIEGGRVISIEPSSKNIGTTIEINSLFYNVPARKKFQKPINVNNYQISKALTHIFLGNQNVGVEYINNDKKIFSSPNYQSLELKQKTNLKIKDILGEKMLSSMKWIFFEDGPIKIYGYICEPDFCKRTRSSQYLHINNRSVYSLLISKSIKDAYGTRISENTHPVFLLNIDMPKEFVDVNVHPQKKEIRLNEEIFIKQSINEAINSGFMKIY